MATRRAALSGTDTASPIPNSTCSRHGSSTPAEFIRRRHEPRPARNRHQRPADRPFSHDSHHQHERHEREARQILKLPPARALEIVPLEDGHIDAKATRIGGRKCLRTAERTAQALQSIVARTLRADVWTARRSPRSSAPSRDRKRTRVHRINHLGEFPGRRGKRRRGHLRSRTFAVIALSLAR